MIIVLLGLVLDAVSIHMRLLVRREGTARTATTRGTAYAMSLNGSPVISN
jgi:hypothetical protein